MKDVYQLLAEDHRVIASLLDRLKGTRRPMERHRLLEQVSLELIPHAMAEEAVFYPKLDESREGAARHHNAEDEHRMAETLVTQLHQLVDDDEAFEACRDELERSLLDHIDREELVLFEMGRAAMSEVQAVRLAHTLGEAKQDVRERLVRAAEMARSENARGPVEHRPLG